MSKRYSFSLFGSACALALTSSVAEAQPRPDAVPATAVALNWVRLNGAESCTSSQSLARAVEARVGGTVFVPLSNADWAIEGRIERRDRTWVATLAAARAPGQPATRVIERVAPDCAAIDEQVVTVIALLLDANNVRATRSADVPSQPCPDPPPPRVVRVEVPVRQTVLRDPIERRRLAVDLSIGGAFEQLPTPAMSAQLAVEGSLAWPIVRLRGGVSFVGPSFSELRWSAGAAQLTSLATAAHLDVCLSHPHAAWMTFCPGIAAGIATATATVSATSRSTTLPSAALVLRAAAEWPLNPRWSARFYSEFTANLVTPDFAVVEQDTGRVLGSAGARSPVGASVGVAISWLLPSENR